MSDPISASRNAEILAAEGALNVEKTKINYQLAGLTLCTVTMMVLAILAMSTDILDLTAFTGATAGLALPALIFHANVIRTHGCNEQTRGNLIWIVALIVLIGTQLTAMNCPAWYEPDPLLRVALSSFIFSGLMLYTNYDIYKKVRDQKVTVFLPV